MAATGAAPVRIAQVANFYGPQSGGLRTTVDMLGRGYVAAGFDRVLVVPGDGDRDEHTPAGRRITLRARLAPGGGGYHFFSDWRQVAGVLAQIGIDRLEVSDKLTLWPLGPWAREHGVAAVLLSHERLDAIVAPRLPSWAAANALARAADRCNRRLAAAFARVVAASAFSCDEWHRVGADNVVRVPLGVDLATFRPSPLVRSSGLPAELVCVGRLSKEKRPDLAVGALRELLDAGIPARLTMVGAGPEDDRLRTMAAARGLPVCFTGHLSDRHEVARLLATADVVLAPCPVEAFGLSVLEALACGTPVVTSDQGAAHELLAAGCGTAAAPRASALAAAVATVVGWHRGTARISAQTAARRRAEQYPWSATVAAMLAVHQLTAPVEVAKCG